MTPTVQQQAFLDALTGTRDNLALVARAGCGKTSTILLGVDAIVKAEPQAEVTVCAYNKAIADEVGAKLKSAGHSNWQKVQAATLHSMGWGLVRFVFKSAIDDKKVRNIISGMNEDRDLYEQYGNQISALVRMGKQSGVGFFPTKQIGDIGMWYALADHYDINGLDDTSDMDQVVSATQNIYRRSLAQIDVADFDDMVLFPLIKNLRVKFTKDYLFLDEAQDLSPARQALARKFMKPHTGRMIVVGDDRQAIYGFSGADADAMPNLIRELSAKEMPLSVTWRCPKAVVTLAQSLVPDIEAAPSAAQGAVRQMAEVPDDLGAEDAILCRNTAPLISLAYKLIRSGKPCKVEGRSIGEGLAQLAKRWKVTTIDALLKKLDTYKEREVQKAMARGNDAKVEEVEDRVATLVEICQACIAQQKTSLADVLSFIDSLFADGAEGVTVLCTYHRSKGREFPRVFLLEHAERCPSRAAKQPWQRAQENNLAYVAFTRAQKELVFVG